MNSAIDRLIETKLMVLARGVEKGVLVKAVGAIADAGVTVFESTFDHRHADCVEENAAKIAALPQSDADFREFIRDFFGNSELCELDAQGRIKIPQNLREYARITKDLVTTGAMNKVEIWSAEAKADFDMAKKMKDRKFTDKLKEYSI